MTKRIAIVALLAGLVACSQAAEQVEEDIQATGEAVDDTAEDVEEGITDPKIDDHYRARERVEETRTTAMRHEGAAEPAHEYAVAVVRANRINAYKDVPRPDDQSDNVADAIEEAAEAQPDEAAYLWLDAGRAYHALGRPDPALEAFRRAWESKPTASAAYGMLALDPESSTAICRETLEHVPDETERVRFLAACASTIGEQRGADEASSAPEDASLDWAPESARDLYSGRAPEDPWHPPGVCGTGCGSDRHFCIRSCDSADCLDDCSGQYRSCIDDCVSPAYED